MHKTKKLFVFYGSIISAIILLSVYFYHYRLTYPNRTKYPKISFHEHYFKGGNINSYLNIMDKYNIQKVVFLPTGETPDNHGYKENMSELLKLQKKYPDKIISFATTYGKDPDALKIISDAVKNGAGGIKLIDWHTYADPYYPVNAPIVLRLFQYASDHHLPVLLHLELDGRYPNQNKQFEEVVKAFPDVKFIVSHYCGAYYKLGNCDYFLAKYQNVYADVSMGMDLISFVKRVTSQSEVYRNFIIKHQDKLMWGNDVIIGPPGIQTKDSLEDRFQIDFDLLEKEYYATPLINTPGVLKGFKLPPSVLRKLYYDNAAKILFKAN